MSSLHSSSSHSSRAPPGGWTARPSGWCTGSRRWRSPSLPRRGSRHRGGRGGASGPNAGPSSQLESSALRRQSWKNLAGIVSGVSGRFRITFYLLLIQFSDNAAEICFLPLVSRLHLVSISREEAIEWISENSTQTNKHNVGGLSPSQSCFLW